MRNDGLNVSHLTLGVGVKVRSLALMPTEDVAHIGSTPSGQWHTPTDATVQPSLPVPVAVGCKGQCAAQSVDIGVGRMELDTVGQLSVVRDSFQKELASLFITIMDYLVDAVDGEVGFTPTLPCGGCKFVLVGSGLEDTRQIGTDVAVAMQLGVGNSTNAGFELGRTAETAVIEQPHGALAVGQRHYLQHQLGIGAPAFVT